MSRITEVWHVYLYFSILIGAGLAFGAFIATTTIASNWNGKTVDYGCSACGNKGTVNPLNGNCKLHWRVDWPARWSIFGVDFESCGKDHASLGGSVHTAKPICKEIFKTEPPVIKPAEFIQLQGAKMSGSVGNLVSLKQWLEVANPELYRFMILSYRPDTAIEFDIAGNSFLLLHDRFERAERLFYKWEKSINESADAKLVRAYELSLIEKSFGKLNVQLPFSSAILLSQLFDGKSWDSIADFLKSSGNVKGKISSPEKKQVLGKLSKTKFWIEKYGQNFKISFVQLADINMEKIDPAAKALFPAIAQGIAIRLRNRRLALNLSQQALATRSGVSLGSLKRFEAKDSQAYSIWVENYCCGEGR